MSSALTLRRPVLADELVVRQAQSELEAEGFDFAWELGPEGSWPAYLDRLDRLHEGLNLPEGVMKSTFYLAEVHGEVVGSTSIRYELNQYLREFGGHIGYCVRPAFRRMGYATTMLQLQIEAARQSHIDEILVTCLETNVASAAVIERCGGAYEYSPTRPDGAIFRRYWFSRPD
ncbi:MAG: GNAT family N-acetyltransferase [Actinobacteria bacterium]|nr:GNAT family N-acetyltransferase [Actinomycetota bacterium]